MARLTQALSSRAPSKSVLRTGSIGALAAACALSCSAPAPSGGEIVDTQSSAIQGGSLDTTHNFAVGVLELEQEQQGMVSFCSGVLLAPNLVATARHCVAQLSNAVIDCGTSQFGDLFPIDKVFVTDQPTITSKSKYVGVTDVIVPTGANQVDVCGNDIALLVLQTNIVLPQYVEPVIDPPMTSSQYQPIVTAIGYGVSTPEDTTGATAGVRRIKENVDIFCIPNDPNYVDCFNIPMGRQAVTAGEFISGDSTCEGDSGSGAFEQSNFDAGKWVAFGILSRGGVSADGTTCEQPTYTRFDAWGPLILQAITEAQQQATAQKASYALPAWVATAGVVDAGQPCANGSCVQSATMAGAGSQTVSSGSTGSPGCAAAGSAGAGRAASSAAPLALVALAALGRRRRRS